MDLFHLELDSKLSSVTNKNDMIMRLKSSYLLISTYYMPGPLNAL